MTNEQPNINDLIKNVQEGGKEVVKALDAHDNEQLENDWAQKVRDARKAVDDTVKSIPSLGDAINALPDVSVNMKDAFGPTLNSLRSLVSGHEAVIGELGQKGQALLTDARGIINAFELRAKLEKLDGSIRERFREAREKLFRFAKQHDRDDRRVQRLEAIVVSALQRAETDPQNAQMHLDVADKAIADVEAMIATELGWEKNKMNDMAKIPDGADWQTILSGKPGFVYKKIDGRIYAFQPTVPDIVQTYDPATNEWSDVPDEKAKTILPGNVDGLRQSAVDREVARLQVLYPRQGVIDAVRAIDASIAPTDVSFGFKGTVLQIALMKGREALGMATFDLQDGAIDYPPVDELARRLVHAYRNNGTPMLNDDENAQLGLLRRSEGFMTKENGAVSAYSYEMNNDGVRYLVNPANAADKKRIDVSGPRWELAKEKPKERDPEFMKAMQEYFALAQRNDAALTNVRGFAKGRLERTTGIVNIRQFIELEMEANKMLREDRRTTPDERADLEKRSTKAAKMLESIQQELRELVAENEKKRAEDKRKSDKLWDETLRHQDYGADWDATFEVDKEIKDAMDPKATSDKVEIAIAVLKHTIVLRTEFVEGRARETSRRYADLSEAGKQKFDKRLAELKDMLPKLEKRLAEVKLKEFQDDLRRQWNTLQHEDFGMRWEYRLDDYYRDAVSPNANENDKKVAIQRIQSAIDARKAYRDAQNQPWPTLADHSDQGRKKFTDRLAALEKMLKEVEKQK